MYKRALHQECSLPFYNNVKRSHTAYDMMKSDIEERVRMSQDITEFQRRVYLALLDVPRGETITYKQLADRIGCRSAQAVGQALKRNPFAPEVPCHRVIASDGTLGGFHGQREGAMIERKAALLRAEKANQ